MPFAIIKTGGKQYKVQAGAILLVEKLSVKDGQVVFDDVLLIDDGKETIVGKPMIAGAKVTAEVTGEKRGPKVRVVHYKAKTGYHKVYGHRQTYTQVKITAIAGEKTKKEAK